MGWCSATEIMDAAVKAADVAVTTLVRNVRGSMLTDADRGAMDDAIRPMVAAIAKALRDGEWDCIEESDYFDRFPQEMLGLDDRGMLKWYMERLSDAVEDEDPKAIAAHSQRVAAFSAKVGG